MWNNEAELNFLEIYQTEPILWKPTHQFHKDKKKLHDAWARISEQTNFPIDELKKKKVSLMATFRGHIRNINASLKSGAGCDEVHKPAWFAFELMNSFLGHLYKCKGTVNTVNQNYQPCTSLELDEACIDANTMDNIQLPTAGTSSQDPTEADNSKSFASPVIQRRRKNPVELQEAGKHMKDAMTTLNKVLQKQEAPEDDCDRFGKILANKLRKLPDLKRMQLMWEIDGLYIKTIQSVPFPAANNQFVPSPSPSPTSYSVCSTYSEPMTSQTIITPQASSFYSEPSPILNDMDDKPVIHLPESSQKVPSKCITILSNKVLAPAEPASHSDDNNIVHQVFFDAMH